VEFGVEIGEYRGVVRVPRRVFRSLVPERPNPRAVRRCVIVPADPVREHCRAEAAAAATVGRDRKNAEISGVRLQEEP
jgi:hypothetical protein